MLHADIIITFLKHVNPWVNTVCIVHIFSIQYNPIQGLSNSWVQNGCCRGTTDREDQLKLVHWLLTARRVGIPTYPLTSDPHTPLPVSSPSRIQGNPQDERRRQMRERVRQSSGLSLKFIFARPLYTLNNIFGGSAYCLHTGHLKTLQQLDLQQKLDVTHILFRSQESFLSFHLQAC